LADGSSLGERRFEPGVVQRHRLQIDTRRWMLSKMLPKVFGDKVDLTSGGQQLQASLPDLELARRAMHWIGSLQSRDVIDVEALPAPAEVGAEAEAAHVDDPYREPGEDDVGFEPAGERGRP
jgi:hypothetical protein